MSTLGAVTERRLQQFRVPTCAFWLALALAACGGGADEGISEGDLAGAVLEVTPRSAWSAANAGCEGLLQDDSPRTFAVAEGEPELLAAIDLSDGHLICVDTFVSFETELGADSLAMDRLWTRYMATLQELGPELTAAPRLAVDPRGL